MSKKRSIFSYALLGLTTLGLIGAGCAFGLYLWASNGLPSITKVEDYRPAQVTTIFARDGSVMGYLFREKRFLVNLEQMAPKLKWAFLAAEDAEFYTHPGINYKAIARAFVANLKAGRTVQGGSTITQQVVKRLVVGDERSLKRKAQEALLAFQLEDRLTKDQILYIYLNQIYLGHSTYGVEAAARVYFAKNASDLTIAECAVLATLPKAPSDYNPYSNPEGNRTRQLWVLGQMHEKGFITDAEYEEAKAQPMVFKSMPDPSWTIGSWYLEEVRRQLLTLLSESSVTEKGIALDVYGEDALYTAGLNIYTAMEPEHQRAAEQALRAGLHEACRRRGWRGSLQNIPSNEFEKFLQSAPFKPTLFDNAGWVKGLVVKVEKSGADVRLGTEYTGRIAVSELGWARTPNTNISPEAAGRVTDATKVLTVGDVIWVSAVGAQGTKNPVSAPADSNPKHPVPPYDASKVTKEAPIPLTLEQWPDLQGAMASIDVKDGDVVALAGGYSFSPDSQFNRATQARRQPGSSFKPIVYSAALDQGFTAGSILLDSPFVLPASPGGKMWTPGNFDGKFLGPILLSQALAKSRNVCTVRVAQAIGMDAIIRRAHDLGIQGDIPPVLSVSLGSYEVTPLSIASAYTAFADGGIAVTPRIITEVRNAWNDPIVPVVPVRREVLTPQNAYIMATLLKGVVTSGTAAKANVLGRPTAGKTGTSNDERDAWFIGFSPYLVTSTYIGYDNNTPMGKMETGGRAALPVFIAYRQAIDHLYPPDDFVKPEGINFISIDPNTGYPGPGVSLPFAAGTEPGVGTDPTLLGPEDQDVQTGVDIMKEF